MTTLRNNLIRLATYLATGGLTLSSSGCGCGDGGGEVDSTLRYISRIVDLWA